VRRAGFDHRLITLYVTRHASIVRQLKAGTPIKITASLHDTSVAMIEAHYGKYIAEFSDSISRAALLDTSQSARMSTTTSDTLAA
jgi:hypothetical protein